MSPSLEAETMNFRFWDFRVKEMVLLLAVAVVVDENEWIVRVKKVLLVRPIRPSILSDCGVHQTVVASKMKCIAVSVCDCECLRSLGVVDWVRRGMGFGYGYGLIEIERLGTREVRRGKENRGTLFLFFFWVLLGVGEPRGIISFDYSC